MVNEHAYKLAWVQKPANVSSDFIRICMNKNIFSCHTIPVKLDLRINLTLLCQFWPVGKASTFLFVDLFSVEVLCLLRGMIAQVDCSELRLSPG